jgi:hypothetical protein
MLGAILCRLGPHDWRPRPRGHHRFGAVVLAETQRCTRCPRWR